MVRQLSSRRVTDAPIRRSEGETLNPVPANNEARRAYAVRPDYQELLIEPIAAMRLQLVPAIGAFLFYDASLNVWTDVLNDAPLIFNREESVNTTVLGAMTTSDYFYLGFRGVVGGVLVDVGATPNANAAILTCQYSNAQRDWTALTITDGTISPAGVTLGADGVISWTAPTAWRSALIGQLVLPPGAPAAPVDAEQMFWLRFAVNATLTAGLILVQLTPLGKTAVVTDDVAALTGGIFLKAAVEYTMSFHPSIGAVEVMAQGGAATTARASWIAR